jgi:hypothetical protein
MMSDAPPLFIPIYKQMFEAGTSLEVWAISFLQNAMPMHKMGPGKASV